MLCAAATYIVTPSASYEEDLDYAKGFWYFEGSPLTKVHVLNKEAAWATYRKMTDVRLGNFRKTSGFSSA